MEHEFWLNKWQSNDIGFNQAQVNPHLIAYSSMLGGLAGKHVYVPLCGKTTDMQWLLEQGALVSGVDISHQAIEAFFAEREMARDVWEREPFTVYQAENITLYAGDFFALHEPLGHIDLIYDRASLIALPAAMRARYAAQLTQISQPSTQMLLITLAYGGDAQGPPFSVTDDEVSQLYQTAFEIERLGHHDPLTLPMHLQTRGFEHPTESVFRLVKRS